MQLRKVVLLIGVFDYISRSANERDAVEICLPRPFAVLDIFDNAPFKYSDQFLNISTPDNAPPSQLHSRNCRGFLLSTIMNLKNMSRIEIGLLTLVRCLPR